MWVINPKTCHINQISHSAKLFDSTFFQADFFCWWNEWVRATDSIRDIHCHQRMKPTNWNPFNFSSSSTMRLMFLLPWQLLNGLPMKFGTHIHSAQRMNSITYTVDHLTFPLAPPWGWHLWLCVKCLHWNLVQIYVLLRMKCFHHQQAKFRFLQYFGLWLNTCKINGIPISLSCTWILLLINKI